MRLNTRQGVDRAESVNQSFVKFQQEVTVDCPQVVLSVGSCIASGERPRQLPIDLAAERHVSF